MKTKYALPSSIIQLMQELRSQSNKKDKALAESILNLSDHFVFATGEQTPWDKRETFDAYLFYFFVLNYFRWMKLIDHAQHINFFKSTNSLIDFGAGLGTATLALYQTLPDRFQKATLIERSEKALQFIKQHQSYFPKDLNLEKNQPANFEALNDTNPVLLFSYSLVELKSIPDWIFTYDKIIVMEPSTQDVGRQLMGLRQTFIDKGYSVLAPCTHQGRCPLLEKSKTDWCHDRVEIDIPDWLQKIETHMPIKNRTLTFSYLILQKKSSATKNTEYQHPENTARIVGDPLFEKGRVRQLICRGEEREFLTQLDRDRKNNTRSEWLLDRGDLYTLPDNIEYKSNEIRLK